jgi:feruloyl esterase
LFGLDPQARLDYGHAAVGSLTPMAKALIRQAYGREPDRSYIAGTSNGGRHAMVAAARYPEQFDGALAHSPGLRLPLAALANMANAQRWAQVAPQQAVNGLPDLESAMPLAERGVLARAVLARCDALDGLVDGSVNDLKACRTAFDPQRDLPVCAGARDGRCLSAAQIAVIGAAFAPVRSRAGVAVYSGFPFDPGIVQRDWAEWKFRSSVRPGRNPVSVGFIFAVPPVADRTMAQDPAKTAAYALGLDLDALWPLLHATDGTYREAAMSFMPPPQAERMDAFRARGAKLLVFHGTADPIFSVDDTEAWYRALDQHHQGQAQRFARFYRVPGMGHSRGGPATDQYDALSALLAWVEQGRSPGALVAQARGAGNAGGVNSELPADWSPGRTRPLCPYPQVARYRAGDPESAASFACEE